MLPISCIGISAGIVRPGIARCPTPGETAPGVPGAQVPEAKKGHAPPKNVRGGPGDRPYRGHRACAAKRAGYQ